MIDKTSINDHMCCFCGSISIITRPDNIRILKRACYCISSLKNMILTVDTLIMEVWWCDPLSQVVKKWDLVRAVLQRVAVLNKSSLHRPRPPHFCNITFEIFLICMKMCGRLMQQRFAATTLSISLFHEKTRFKFESKVKNTPNISISNGKYSQKDQIQIWVSLPHPIMIQPNPVHTIHL